ncbi:hypothetical protein [Rhodococcus qingshengii]|uniref:hypothetical protein n=1 Tax=Rhodococcus qingshengii TaxID=334542 RepID=UPI001BEB7E2E|nr:hypothetical protein [Rhodococcus qingshengii]MBT2275673.1 hypothetical protein [Rhodococcus qingshengii]
MDNMIRAVIAPSVHQQLRDSRPKSAPFHTAVHDNSRLGQVGNIVARLVVNTGFETSRASESAAPPPYRSINDDRNRNDVVSVSRAR